MFLQIDVSLIIFSEIFYPKGWKSYINGKQVTNHRFNYTLRGLEVPSGNHKIEFIFDPNIVNLSSRISLFSSLGFILLVFILALRRKKLKKKILIISYYWPPAGGPGVQRWLKFVKYLPEFNISPVLFVPKNANYPIKDNSLKSEVSNDLEIIKLPIFELSSFLPRLKSLNSIRSGNISKIKISQYCKKLFFL